MPCCLDYMQRKHVSRVIPGEFVKINRSGNVWGKIDFTSAWACTIHEFYRPSAVKIPIPNISWFPNVIPNCPRMTRRTSYPCIKYHMQLWAKRALRLGRCFSYPPAPRAPLQLVQKTSSSAKYGKSWLRVT